MADEGEHTRRDFLKGRSAAQTLSDKLQRWTDRRWSPAAAARSGTTALHAQATRRIMACEFEIQYHASDLEAAEPVLQALDLIESIEDQLTIYRDQSEVIEINRRAAASAVQVEPHLFALLQQSVKLFHETQGAFDFTSTPLSRIWGFLRREGRLPSEVEISEALAKVGCDKVLLDESQRFVKFSEPGVEINFNSIGKGYALDRAAAQLDEQGVTDYLCHGGRSSVLARGCNRSDPDRGWTLGLRDPLEPDCRLAEFYLRDRALATAGGGTQFFEHAGKTYSHVIDPRSGRPSRGVYTATVLAPTAAEADALATAFFVMGVAAVTEFCAVHPEIAAVLVCPAPEDEGISLHTCGLKENDWKLLGESG